MRRYGESKQHYQQKERIGALLREKGFNVWVDCYPIDCQTEKGKRTYWPDVYAENFSMLQPYDGQVIAGQKGTRRIVVEVQGFKGHKSKAAFESDRLRIADIRSSHGQDIESFNVTLGRRKAAMDIRNWSDDDILQELRIENS
jgi:hypothetical protein